MAKLMATEGAQAVIDDAVQIFGGLGVTKGVKVEELYREIRALRIYEGASEVQKVVLISAATKLATAGLPVRAGGRPAFAETSAPFSTCNDGIRDDAGLAGRRYHPGNYEGGPGWGRPSRSRWGVV